MNGRRIRLAVVVIVGVLLLQGCATSSANDLAEDEARSAIQMSESALDKLRSEEDSDDSFVRSLQAGQVAYSANLIGASDSDLKNRTFGTPYAGIYSAELHQGHTEVQVVSIGKGERSEGGFYKKVYVYLCVQLTDRDSAGASWSIDQVDCPTSVVDHLANPRGAALVKLGDLDYTSPLVDESR